jgi:parallel beta-helix repeat protein
MRHFKVITAIFAVFVSAAALADTIEVRPGQSIQAAVDQANRGDTILIFPGTYREGDTPCPTDYSHACAVAVTKDDIRIIGASWFGHRVVIENAGKQDQGISVAKTGAAGPDCLIDPEQRIQGSTIEGITVNNFDGDGIALFCVDNFTVLRVSTNDNGEYGIYPSHSGFGQVTLSSATGANDTGIYVGQSHDVRVNFNSAHGNVSGFEIENSINVELDYNLATGNTAGILSFVLPHLHVNVNEDNIIHHNTVLMNNKPNTCIDPQDPVCNVPPGTGILLLAPQRNEVRNNVVLGNDSFGIILADYCTANMLPPNECFSLGIEVFPNDNRIENNIALNNGAHPPPIFPGGDLLWTQLGDRNCWLNNTSQINVPPNLPTCQ